MVDPGLQHDVVGPAAVALLVRRETLLGRGRPVGVGAAAVDLAALAVVDDPERDPPRPRRSLQRPGGLGPVQAQVVDVEVKEREPFAGRVPVGVHPGDDRGRVDASRQRLDVSDDDLREDARTAAAYAATCRASSSALNPHAPGPV